MYFHGSTDAVLKDGEYVLLPPVMTGVLQEDGRKKNLNRIFFTSCLGLAKIYAGRARQRFGGNPVVYRVIPMGKVETIDERPGASVYMAEWAFIEKIKTGSL